MCIHIIHTNHKSISKYNDTHACTRPTGIINAELLSWLPPGAVVINGARGAHIDARALLHALDSGHVGSCLLDVFETEPLPEDDPLWLHPRVRITPHVASVTNIQVRWAIDTLFCLILLLVLLVHGRGVAMVHCGHRLRWRRLRRIGWRCWGCRGRRGWWRGALWTAHAGTENLWTLL